MVALATLDDVETRVQRPLEDVEADDAQLMLELVSGLVRAAAGWHLSAVEGDTASVAVDGGPWLFVPTLHLTGVTSVVVDGTEVLVDNYAFDTHGVIYLANGAAWFPGVTGKAWHISRAAVTFDHGWPLGHPALDVARNVTLQAARRQLLNPENVLQTSLGSFSETVRPPPGGIAEEGLTLSMAEEALIARVYGLGRA